MRRNPTLVRELLESQGWYRPFGIAGKLVDYAASHNKKEAIAKAHGLQGHLEAVKPWCTETEWKQMKWIAKRIDRAIYEYIPAM